MQWRNVAYEAPYEYSYPIPFNEFCAVFTAYQSASANRWYLGFVESDLIRVILHNQSMSSEADATGVFIVMIGK